MKDKLGMSGVGMPVVSSILTAWIGVLLGFLLPGEKGQGPASDWCERRGNGGRSRELRLAGLAHPLPCGATGNSSIHLGKTGLKMSLLVLAWQDPVTADPLLLHALYS